MFYGRGAGRRSHCLGCAVRCCKAGHIVEGGHASRVDLRGPAGVLADQSISRFQIELSVDDKIGAHGSDRRKLRRIMYPLVRLLRSTRGCRLITTAGPRASLRVTTHAASQADLGATIDALRNSGIYRRSAASYPSRGVLMAHQWQGVIPEYRDRLPFTESDPVVTLGEGGTPLVHAKALDARTGATVYVKVEGMNPTGSFQGSRHDHRDFAGTCGIRCGLRFHR